MPNDWHNLLEVPGNRLTETGSRQMNFCILEVPGNRLPNTGSNKAEDLFKKKKKKETQEPGNRLLEKIFRKDQPVKRFSRSLKDHVFQETHTKVM
ncbi:hypothetical protein GQ457_11G033240 [Hibiscus cannabinus]